MGGTSYSDRVYTSRVASVAASGASLFAHDAAIRSGSTAMAVHETLDPARKNSVGKLVRESFDSDAHPNSRPVAVFFDVTGSMRTVPRLFATKLNTLMASLVKKGFLPNPHVLFGAIGDATCDRVPLQVGQFEGGNEMDAALTNIVLEGGGGGQDTESYELALYFAARHTDCHAWTKRKQKGYLFILGDERPYSYVKASEVRRLIGVDIGKDIPFAKILKEAQEKFHVFWIMPGGTSHFDDDDVIEPIRDLFGQHFIKMPQPEDVVETITSIIGVTEGYDVKDVGAALRDLGSDAGAVARATSAVAVYASSSAVARPAVVSGTGLTRRSTSTGVGGPKRTAVERL